MPWVTPGHLYRRLRTRTNGPICESESGAIIKYLAVPGTELKAANAYFNEINFGRLERVRELAKQLKFTTNEVALTESQVRF